MLKIRLQRVGRKHEPTFRVVLTDSKNSTKSGKFHEVLGSYDPRKSTESFNAPRIKEWMGKGAQLSDTLHNLLITHKVIDGKKKNVLPRKSPIVKEETQPEGADAPADTKVADAPNPSASEPVTESAPAEVSNPPVGEDKAPAETPAEVAPNPPESGEEASEPQA